ncbi:unnamed protein product [Vitrella brassicaformis CCMP3155]|uniref:Uncharacterized protein n=2 Tax=Vitrella brassicaformis TaxID=1169539 RepID=A0A0G4FVW4_VITBC|nr:unnamed protein product [Vitrella brassicaformis CCMP3155]|eukprot:CEM19324.1 unnamed protein product [Vitrella brassicaformis CCMP3155]
MSIRHLREAVGSIRAVPIEASPQGAHLATTRLRHRSGVVALLIGPAGSGKSSAVCTACEMASELQERPVTPVFVDGAALTAGTTVGDEHLHSAALKCLLSELASRLPPPHTRLDGMSVVDLKRELKELLEIISCLRMKVVIVVENLDHLCLAGFGSGGQNFLYTLLDLSHHAAIAPLMVATSRDFAVNQLLEKRLTSRWAAPEVIHFGLPGTAEAATAGVRAVLMHAIDKGCGRGEGELDVTMADLDSDRAADELRQDVSNALEDKGLQRTFARWCLAEVGMGWYLSHVVEFIDGRRRGAKLANKVTKLRMLQDSQRSGAVASASSSSQQGGPGAAEYKQIMPSDAVMGGPFDQFRAVERYLVQLGRCEHFVLLCLAQLYAQEVAEKTLAKAIFIFSRVCRERSGDDVYVRVHSEFMPFIDGEQQHPNKVHPKFLSSLRELVDLGVVGVVPPHPSDPNKNAMAGDGEEGLCGRDLARQGRWALTHWDAAHWMDLIIAFPLCTRYLQHVSKSKTESVRMTASLRDWAAELHKIVKEL